MITTFLRRYWPSMLTLGVILYATMASDPVGVDEMPPIPHLDKIIHAVMMGGLTGAVAFDIQRAHRDRRVLTFRLMCMIWLAVGAFSVLDEIAQATLTPDRSGDSWDLLADMVGATVAVFIAPPVIWRVLRVPR